MVISDVALVNAFHRDMSVTDITTVEMDLMKSNAVSNYVYIAHTYTQTFLTWKFLMVNFYQNYDMIVLNSRE